MTHPLNSDTEPSSENRCGFVAMVGPANAGKSTLLNALVGAKVSIVSPKQQTTRNRITGIKTTSRGQIAFVDTPGFLARRYRGELARYLSDALTESITGADAIMLVVDGTIVCRDKELPEKIAETLKRRQVTAPAIIAINKIDLLERLLLLPAIERLAAVFGAQSAAIDIVPVSAKRNDGLAQLEAAAFKHLPAGPNLFPEGLVSAENDEFLASEIVREKLFDRLHKELPYSVAVAIERWDDSEEILRINAVIFVERDAQKGIVIGERGQTLKAVGTAARLELEKIFSTKVYLELFVRVEENWTRSSRGLERAGFDRR